MIAYASRTGNVRYIVTRLGLPAVEVKDHLTLSEPFLLMTYTDGLGDVPEVVQRFMERNGAYCKGVIASGNRNFGHLLFGRAGDILAEQWQIPLVCKLDLRGFPQDYETIRQFYEDQIGRRTGHGVVHKVIFAAQQ